MQLMWFDLSRQIELDKENLMISTLKISNFLQIQFAYLLLAKNQLGKSLIKLQELLTLENTLTPMISTQDPSVLLNSWVPYQESLNYRLILKELSKINQLTATGFILSDYLSTLFGDMWLLIAWFPSLTVKMLELSVIKVILIFKELLLRKRMLKVLEDINLLIEFSQEKIIWEIWLVHLLKNTDCNF